MSNAPTPGPAAASGGGRRVFLRWKQLVAVEQGEWRPLLWSFSYFFVLLCGYYIIRPMRDEMGIAGGVEHLQWMFSGTFLAMLAVVPLFGWVARRFSPHRFLPWVYYFFIGNLLVFFVLFRADITPVYVARAFFIWTSVFNLFIVSVFWSFMADIFSNDQAKRLFGVIAAGGTAGALTGPALTAILVLPLGPTNLLLFSTAFLGWAVFCIHRLAAWRRSATARRGTAGTAPKAAQGRPVDRPIGGSVLAGVRLVFQSPYLAGICLLMLLFTTLATFLYFQQAYIIREHIGDPARRTALFAAMDFSVNGLALVTQLLLTSRMIDRLGLGWTLAVVPLMLVGGFLALSFLSALWVLVALQILRRAGDYAVMRPGREMLYVVLSKEEKYKAKNFIDTVIYRGGDAVSAWVYAGMQAMGLSGAGISLAAVPLAGAWAVVAYRLGKRQERIASGAPTGGSIDGQPRRTQS
ncbi:MAG: MFS transporter [Desulfobacteraceae bacterium]|nr:MAG: MFS transporter [Desulfobacteraceae bacterium]